MNIYDYYLESNRDKKWRNLYQSTSMKNRGKTFAYISTNYRSLFTFISTFKKFCKYKEKDRREWDLSPITGQETAKQWVVNMTHSKLFKKDKGMYSLTAKGEAFSDFLTSDFPTNSRWILVYLFLSNSYFSFVPNYIRVKCLEIVRTLRKLNIRRAQLLEMIESFLKNDNITIEDLFYSDIFWILSFYKDQKFITLFNSSSESEREKLFNYVYSNYKNKKYCDCISYKYKENGQYTIKTFKEDLMTIYVTILIEEDDPLSLNELIESSLNAYSNIYNLDKLKISEFIENHKAVFQIIFDECYRNINNNEELASEEPINESDYIEEKIDDTTTVNSKKIRRNHSILKKMAKEASGYKCELEELNMCKYFESRVDGKNYLEVHRLIPLEFSNEYESSIEIIENYIALCPHCHSLIHHGSEKERRAALINLFELRKNSLKQKKIDLNIEALLEYYGIKE